MRPTMAHPSPSDETRDRREAEAEAIVRDLDRRLGILESADEERFGEFGALDWTVSVLAFLVAPLVLVWWGAP